MEIGEAALAMFTSGGLGTAIGYSIRSFARAKADRERVARMAAEQDAQRSQAVLTAYNHARQDLEEAKRLYQDSSNREAECLRRVDSLRDELEQQGRECDQRMSAMQAELDRWRDAVASMAKRHGVTIPASVPYGWIDGLPEKT